MREIKSELIVFNPQTNAQKRITAIWDTGATHTVLNLEDLTDIAAVPTSIVNVSTAGDTVNCPLFHIGISIIPNLIMRGQALGNPKLAKGTALIGMDIIGLGDFSITNLGNETIMSFRYPSLHSVDYSMHPHYIPNQPAANTTQPIKSDAKVGRNDPCPCQSGKKYKNCCMNK